jgi:hypothetical protein
MISGNNYLVTFEIGFVTTVTDLEGAAILDAD